MTPAAAPHPVVPAGRSGPAAGPIAVGAAVAGLALVVYQCVLLATGIPMRMFFLLAALFVAQSVFNGVVLACFVAEINEVGVIGPVARRRAGVRQVCTVLVGALFAMSGVLPLVFAWGAGGKVSDFAVILAIGGLTSAAVLAIVVAPLLYALAIREKSSARNPT